MKIFVAKYIPDVRRWEPRNVGVLVQDSERIVTRFFGEIEPGVTDHRQTRHVFNDPEVYDEWLKFWRGATDVEALTRETFTNYWIAPAGEVWFAPDDSNADDVAEQYFRELVGEARPVERETKLEGKVEQLLRATGITQSKGFQRNVAVEADPNKLSPPERLMFQYGFENGHLTVGQRVAVDPAQIYYLHDALWKFSNAPSGISKVALIAYGDTAGEAQDLEPPLVHLSREATIIDVETPEAVGLVADAFGVA